MGAEVSNTICAIQYKASTKKTSSQDITADTTSVQ